MIIAALAASSCSSDTVSPFFITGRWVVENTDPAISISFNLVQRDSRITGDGSQCSTSAPPGTACGRYGIVGYVDESGVHLDLAYMRSGGNTSLYHFDGQQVTAARITGSIRTADPGTTSSAGVEMTLRRG
jgi:hypothetical protein